MQAIYAKTTEDVKMFLDEVVRMIFNGGKDELLYNK